jgi:hypothetical protein
MAIPMDEERADRLVASLRARGVMAHLARVGVYQCGVRVVLADGGEALWDTDGVLGLCSSGSFHTWKAPRTSPRSNSWR